MRDEAFPGQSQRPYGLDLTSLLFIAFAILALLLLILLGIAPLGYATVAEFRSSGNSLLNVFRSELGLIGEALWFTISQAAWSATLSILFGYLLGRLLFFHPSRLGRALGRLALVPFGLPSIIVSYAFVLSFGQNGAVNQFLSVWGVKVDFLYTVWAIVIAHTFFNLGYCADTVRSRYMGISADHWKASELMRLGAFQRFRHLEWPNLLGTLVNLWFTVFAFCLSSFAIVLTLGGRPDLTTVEVLIYQYIRYENNIEGAFVAACVQIIFLCVSSWFAMVVSSRFPQGRSLKSAGQQAGVGKHSVGISAAKLLFLGCISIPLGTLVYDGIRAAFSLGFSRLFAAAQSVIFPAVVDSLWVAIPASLLVTFFGLILSLMIARIPSEQRAQRFQNAATLFLLALSPTVLTYAWFRTFLGLDQNPFDYSFLTIISVQTFVFLPLALRTLAPTAIQLHQNWRLTYSSLGLSLGRQVLHVESKALLRLCARSFLLTLAFSIGDVSTPALFGHVDFQPLSLLLLELMGSYQFDLASIVTLVLIASTASISILFSSKVGGSLRNA